MTKKEVESILTKFVLGLQVFLALLQILKITPLGAVIQDINGRLLLSPTYARLDRFPSRDVNAEKTVVKRYDQGIYDLVEMFPTVRTLHLVPTGFDGHAKYTL